MPNARLTEQRVEGYTRILGLDPLATRIGASSSADVLSRRWSRAKENRKLKQMVAELAMDKHMLRDVLRKEADTQTGPRVALGRQDLRAPALRTPRDTASLPGRGDGPPK